MIDVKTATAHAIRHVKSLYEETELSRFMLEEVELSDDEHYWTVTIGFDRPGPPTTGGFPFMPTLAIERVYKVIKIDSNSAELVSMRIRETQEK